MKRRVGLTEKRLSNRRFRKTEEAILEVFFEQDIYISMNKMASRAGVARSTIYNHHRAVKEIVPDYEKYILKRYTRSVRRLTKNKNVHLKTLYQGMLFFILQNKRLFLLFIKTDDRKVFKNMVGVIKSNISRHARVHRNSEKIFAVYTSEVVELLECWGKNGFPEDDLTSVLNDIMYLTDTIRPRLFPIYKPKS